MNTKNGLAASIPNILSTFRLLLAFYFPFCQEQEWLWLIIAGGASDFLDGWIARKWEVQSWQGGLLDAIADKLFALSVLVTFALAGKFTSLWIPAIIARDLTVTAIALYAIYNGLWDSFKKMDARRSGKIATTLQFLLFMIIPLQYGLTPYFLIMTALFSLLAALDYGTQFAWALKKRANNA